MSLFPVASTCCSHGHSCTPSGAAGPGVALLSSTMFSCKEGSSWLSPWRKVPQGVGLVESLPCVSSVPLPKGIWFWICCWRSQAAHGETFCTRPSQGTTKGHLFVMVSLWAPLSVRLSGSMSHGSVRLSKALFYLLSAAAP